MISVRRRGLIVAVAMVIVAAGVFIVFFKAHRPGPPAAQLLPQADAILYVNLRPMRTAMKLGAGIGSSAPEGEKDALNKISQEPEYEDFLRQTGFRFERDLDELALAVHVIAGKTPQGEENRYSEVFVGRFDSGRLSAFLTKISASVETYGANKIFIIAHEGRTVRVSLLDVNKVAVSNLDDPAIIRGMIDRFHHGGGPLGGVTSAGPVLLREYYASVPLGSPAWAIARIAGPASVVPTRNDGKTAGVAQKDAGQNRGPSPNPGAGPKSGPSSSPSASPKSGPALATSPPSGSGVWLPLPAQEWLGGSVLVASLRQRTMLEFRAEVFTSSAELASRVASGAGTYLNLFRAIEPGMHPGGADPDVKALFDSFHVEQQENRVLLTANVSSNFLRKLLIEPSVSTHSDARSENAPTTKTTP